MNCGLCDETPDPGDSIRLKTTGALYCLPCWISSTNPCAVCDGTGEALMTPGRDCGTCNGLGRDWDAPGVNFAHDDDVRGYDSRDENYFNGVPHWHKRSPRFVRTK